jgi:hypothetical protein
MPLVLAPTLSSHARARDRSWRSPQANPKYLVRYERRRLRPPLFSMGVIADVQHADVADGTNHGGTMPRHYRGALATLTRAVDWLGDVLHPSAGHAPPCFIAQLGDLIDHAENEEVGQSKEAFKTALKALKVLPAKDLDLKDGERQKREVPVVNVIGGERTSNMTHPPQTHPPPTQLNALRSFARQPRADVLQA